MWPVASAPTRLRDEAPAGYSSGMCAVYGGVIPDPEAGEAVPPQEWADGLQVSMGLTAEAQATVILKHVTAFLWTAYWLPGGR